MSEFKAACGHKANARDLGRICPECFANTHAQLTAANARIAELEALLGEAETKATISQITAETEKRLRESSERDAERECLWSSDGFNDLWESSCGMAWTFPDEGPKENDMTYCPKCRGVLVVDSND